MTETKHRTRVYEADGPYVAVCEECGGVGGPQDLQVDAQAIAERHEAVGGFERVSS